MAEAEWGGEVEPGGAVIRVPGTKETPDDVRAILFCMVSNISGMDLKRFSGLEKYDDIASHEEMALKIADDEFLEIPSAFNIDRHKPHLEYFTQLLSSMEATNDLETLADKIQSYVYRVAAMDLPSEAVQCIKGIYKVTKMAAHFIKDSTSIPENKKMDWYQIVVDSVWLALEQYETNKRVHMTCYIRIWDMDKTMQGGTKNLRPMRPARPPKPNLPLQGAELVRDMIEDVTRCHFLDCIVKDDVRMDLQACKQVVAQIANKDPSSNPITASGEVVKALVSCYTKYSESTEEDPIWIFQEEIAGVLVTKILDEKEHKFDSLAALFIALATFIRQIMGDGAEKIPKPVCVTIVEATQTALEIVDDYIVEAFEQHAWINFEATMGARLFDEKQSEVEKT